MKMQRFLFIPRVWYRCNGCAGCLVWHLKLSLAVNFLVKPGLVKPHHAADNSEMQHNKLQDSTVALTTQSPHSPACFFFFLQHRI